MDEIVSSGSAVREIQALAVASSRTSVFVEGGVPFAMVPAGYEMQCVEGTLPAPTRARGVVTLRDVAQRMDQLLGG